MTDTMADSERKSLPVHVDMCHQRYKTLESRMKRIEYILYGIAALLVFGEGTVLEVVKRLIKVVPAP